MSVFQEGDIVRYARPESGEESFRFRVLWVAEERVQMVLICNLPIKPVEIVAIDEIEIVMTKGSLERLVAIYGREL